MADKTASVAEVNQTPGQKRAADALARVRELERLPPKKTPGGETGTAQPAYGNYVSYVSALPAQIVMNGLGQSLATLMAAGGRGKKKDDPHLMLYRHIASWLAGSIPEWHKTPPDQLMDRLVTSNQQVYLRAQVEALAYLDWLKKFSRAILEEDASREED